MPDADFNADFDIREVRKGVKRLINEGRYYGKETKPEMFEFQSVEVNNTNDLAVVKTLEKWFIVEYRTDKTPLKTKNVGPYFVSYILRKVDGRWLIEKSTTARAEPAPTKMSRESVSSPTVREGCESVSSPTVRKGWTLRNLKSPSSRSGY